MYKFILVSLFFFLFLLKNDLFSQFGKIAVVNPDSSTTIHTTFQSAVNAAQNGASIYLPAGYWNENITIAKRLNIYGVGHFPNSSPVPPGTSNVSQISFLNGSDSCIIQGLIISALTFGGGQGNISIKNHYILRCRIQNLNLAFWNAINVSNVIIKECVINFSVGATINSVPKNIIFANSYINYCSGLTGSNIYFTNCIFGNHSFNGQNLLIENSIFLRQNSDQLAGLQSSIINNCMFLWGSTNWGTNSGENNIFGQSCSAMFENGSCPEFSYTANYKLKSNSPGKNAGTDGTDIGLFGGDSPFKEGGLPTQPAIIEFNVTKYPENGQIEIKATAASQTK